MKRRTLNCLAVLLLLLSPMAANAILISSSQGDFNLVTREATSADILQTLMEQAWWGDEALALELAALVQVDLGLGAFNLGPRFAYALTSDVPPLPRVAAWCLAVRCGTDEARLFTAGSADPILWVVSVPEPATVLLLGAGLLGIGVMRRRRKF